MDSTATIRRAFFNTPEGQVHYRIGGQGEPLLLLHQTPRSSDSTYGELMPIIANQRLVIAMDNPGYGDSFKPQRQYFMADYAAIVISLLDGLNVKKTSIMGHHTGSFIAIEIAAAYPERVDKLILSFPLALLDEEERQIGVRSLAQYSQFKMKQDGSHLIEIWQNLHQRTAPKGPLEFVNRLFMDYIKANIDSDYTFALRAVFAYPMEKRLPLIQCPTLILWGMEDLRRHNELWGFHAVENRYKVGQLIPRSKTLEFNGPESTGAMINFMPDKLAAAILNFLRSPGI